jgi:hypothetical protein
VSQCPLRVICRHPGPGTALTSESGHLSRSCLPTFPADHCLHPAEQSRTFDLSIAASAAKSNNLFTEHAARTSPGADHRGDHYRSGSNAPVRGRINLTSANSPNKRSAANKTNGATLPPASAGFLFKRKADFPSLTSFGCQSQRPCRSRRWRSGMRLSRSLPSIPLTLSS